MPSSDARRQRLHPINSPAFQAPPFPEDTLLSGLWSTCNSPIPPPPYTSSISLRERNIITMSDRNQAQQKTYHKKATGLAAWTVKKHSKESDLKLYGSCFW